MSSPGIAQIPRLAGVANLAEAQRAGFSVAEASRRLRRLAYAKQRLAFLAAAHLNSTPEWEVKPALALHAWLDAQHATALRTRLIELREPAGRLEQTPDPLLAAALDEVLHARGTVELLSGVYGVLRPALLAAEERYLAETNPLADQPSCRLLKLVCLEEREAIEWGRAALAAVTASPEARAASEAWQKHLGVFLATAGGVDGTEKVPEHKLLTARAAKKFEPNITPRRDARFTGLFDTSTPADSVYLDESRPVEERNLALLFKRVREMDVPEVVAGILAQSPPAEWDQCAQLFRQMWDEARHALLGEVALEARGANWRALPINVTFSHKLATFCTPVERHILLYAIEQSLMPAKRGKRYEWELARASGDALSTTFQDFDWADEVLHVEIARRTLRGRLKGGLAQARKRADTLWKRIARGLERAPFPAGRDDVAPHGWWETFADSTLSHKVAPVEETHVKDWRPLSA
jgi:hypothetical protein